ncbi:MAG: hypothetical protein FJX23_04600 [Alphaproteobacteria bacterium]|nr:hypothetical protein [Alphaproteobacteria bacterium]
MFRKKETSSGERFIVSILTLVFFTGGMAGIFYPRLELLFFGTNTNAEIVQRLPNERENNVTDKSRGLAINAFRHIVEVEGRKHELVLQAVYQPGSIQLRWIPGKRNGVVLNAEGGFSFLSAIGGTANLLLGICSILGIIGFTKEIISSFKAYTESKKK